MRQFLCFWMQPSAAASPSHLVYRMQMHTLSSRVAGSGFPSQDTFLSFCIQPASERWRTNKSRGDRGPSPQKLASSVPRNVAQREAGQGAKPPPPHTSPPDFIGCSSRQPQRARSEGSENGGDYSPGFILTVNFSHSGYKVN